MNTLQSFSYENNEVRTIMIDGEPWFCLTDVCRVLSLSNPTAVVDRLDEDERSKFDLGRQGQAWFINESGLYAVILRSDKPEAKPFRKWVTAEVLPRIRKEGGYVAGVSSSSSEELLAKALLAAQRALEGQSARIAELEAENVGLMEGTAWIDTWDKTEFERIVACAITAGREDYITILYLVRYAGLSLDECFSIDMRTAEKAAKEKALTVRGEDGHERVIPLHQLVYQRIGWLVCRTQDRLFVLRSQTTQEVKSAFKAFFEYYSKLVRLVTNPRPLTFDRLRHTYAMEKYQSFINAGKTPYEARKAVSKLLGHGRDDVTNTYPALLKGGAEDA